MERPAKRRKLCISKDCLYCWLIARHLARGGFCDGTIIVKEICSTLVGSIVYPLDDDEDASTFCQAQRAKLRNLWKCKRTTGLVMTRYHCVSCHKNVYCAHTVTIPPGLPPVPSMCVDCENRNYAKIQQAFELLCNTRRALMFV